MVRLLILWATSWLSLVQGNLTQESHATDSTSSSATTLSFSSSTSAAANSTVTAGTLDPSLPFPAVPESEIGPCSENQDCRITATAKRFTWTSFRRTADSTIDTDIETRTYTATIMTIINLAANATHTTTSLGLLPSGVPPFQTINAEGTRVAQLEYTRHGEVLMTEVAFPTIFMDWSDSLEVEGSYEYQGPNGPECHEGKSALPIIPNPQPPAPDNMMKFYNEEQDPLGVDWLLVPDNTHIGTRSNLKFLHLLPDTDPTIPLSVVSQCRTEVMPYYMTMFGKVQWIVEQVDGGVVIDSTTPMPDAAAPFGPQLPGGNAASNSDTNPTSPGFTSSGHGGPPRHGPNRGPTHFGFVNDGPQPGSSPARPPRLPAKPVSGSTGQSRHHPPGAASGTWFGTKPVFPAWVPAPYGGPRSGPDPGPDSGSGHSHIMDSKSSSGALAPPAPGAKGPPAVPEDVAVDFGPSASGSDSDSGPDDFRGRDPTSESGSSPTDEENGRAGSNEDGLEGEAAGVSSSPTEQIVKGPKTSVTCSNTAAGQPTEGSQENGSGAVDACLGLFGVFLCLGVFMI